MLNPALIDTFAELHRQELLDTAARIRLALRWALPAAGAFGFGPDGGWSMPA